MLTPGTRVGPYEILAKLGEGGMGVVYRAADTKLGRDVALKMLPASVTADPERLARFEREARTLASLNHPHIAQIYGIEDLPTGAGGPQSALVMELVEGEDLAQRIARGALPVDEALTIARQVADAFAAAHEQRIVHRDLKPANIRIRHDGMVKVLDFGLAKAIDAGSGSAMVTNSPTLMSPVAVTGAGTIVGTAAYMSPEQARGRSVDRRADVWAFGCVVYEMLTGRRPFDGRDVADVLAAIVRDAPEFDALPADVTSPVRRLLRRCLEKDPAKRLDSMRDARLELDEVSEATTLADAARQNPGSSRRRGFTTLRAACALVAIGGLAFVAYAIGRGSSRTTAPLIHAELSLSPAESLGGSAVFGRPSRPAFVITSDGSRIVFVGAAGATTQLYVRPLDGRHATAIPGTVGAHTPFLSPDNQWIGFHADGAIRKVSLAGGPVVVVADLKAAERGSVSALVAPGTDFYGASWGEDGIVFGRFNDGLWQVSAAGGVPSRMTTATVGGHRFPHHLPGGRGVLLTVDGDPSQVAVLPRGASEPRRLIEAATDARYVEPSHLVFARDALLMAVPFDLDRLAVTGAPFALEEDLLISDGSGRPAANSGAAHFDVARSGTLVFATGGRYPAEPSRVVWVDRAGRVEALQTSTGGFTRPRLSPDGRRVAVTLRPASAAEPSGIYIADLARNALTPLTRGGEWGPLWSADGSEVLFMMTDGMGRVRADGSAPIERLLQGTAYPHTITRDGATLVFQKTGRDSGADIWVMPLGTDRTPRPLLNSPANESWAELSPDGKWLAYGSDSSGRPEVYVQSFPGPGTREQISSGGGDSPLWNRNGRELFYLSRGEAPGTIRVNTVDVTLGSTVTAGTPRQLFEGRFGRTGGPTAYDVSLDGSRLLMSESLVPPIQPVTRIRVVLNWFEELRRAQTLSK